MAVIVEAKVFFPAKPFQLSPMFVGKANSLVCSRYFKVSKVV